MYRFALRPRWLLFHLLVVVLVVVMVNLGIWQLHRLQDRREFNDDVRTRSAMPVAEFDDVVTAQIVTTGDADPIEWRPVRVVGTYLADEQVVVINRSQGGIVGKNVVTPLQTAAGPLVLVNRGFVAETDTVPPPPEGTVAVTGRIRATERRGFGGLTDAPDGELTELQRLDIDRLAQQLPAPVAPVSVDLVTSDPASPTDPAPLPGPELGEGPHLSYMVQWFIFSICVVIGWVLAMRRSARRPVSAAPAPVPADSPTASADEPTTASH
jgi:surfeit locus 1 family protein